MNWLSILFAINFSLLLLHEMDAIRAKEWKMFIVLKSMREETAYITFSLIHLPLYVWIIYMIWSSGYVIAWLITDVFLFIHAVIHFFFRKHADNEFKSAYSNILIYAMSVLSIVHLVMFCNSVSKL